jgi:hypothetical protein
MDLRSFLDCGVLAEGFTDVLRYLRDGLDCRVLITPDKGWEEDCGLAVIKIIKMMNALA